MLALRKEQFQNLFFCLACMELNIQSMALELGKINIILIPFSLYIIMSILGTRDTRGTRGTRSIKIALQLTEKHFEC
jgi:hypothetical protein